MGWKRPGRIRADPRGGGGLCQVELAHNSGRESRKCCSARERPIGGGSVPTVDTVRGEGGSRWGSRLRGRVSGLTSAGSKASAAMASHRGAGAAATPEFFRRVGPTRQSQRGRGTWPQLGRLRCSAVYLAADREGRPHVANPLGDTTHLPRNQSVTIGPRRGLSPYFPETKGLKRETGASAGEAPECHTSAAPLRRSEPPLPGSRR
jgi:hypothetical protein